MFIWMTTYCQADKSVSTISIVTVTNSVIVSVHFKFIVGSDTSAGLSAAPAQKFSYIFVFWLNPNATAKLLEFKLFSEIIDITLTQMVTKYPTYASFHIYLLNVLAKCT